MRQLLSSSALLGAFAAALLAQPAWAQFEAIGKKPKPAQTVPAAAPAPVNPPPPPSPGITPPKAAAKPAAKAQPERTRPAPQASVSKASLAYLEAMDDVFDGKAKQ